MASSLESGGSDHFRKARAPLIALSGVTLAAATASATLSFKDARRVSSQRPTCDCSACMSSLRLMHVCGLR